jgi:hypothetical protein
MTPMTVLTGKIWKDRDKTTLIERHAEKRQGDAGCADGNQFSTQSIPEVLGAEQRLINNRSNQPCRFQRSAPKLSVQPYGALSI